MNKIIKIFILLLAIVLSVGGVLYFYKTIVSPPQNLKYANKHIDDVNMSIGCVKKINRDTSMDSLFYVVNDKTQLYLKEGYVSSNERDALMESFVKDYLPKFILSCNMKFNKSKWYVSDHNWMKSRIAEINTLKIQNNSKKLLEGSYVDSLSRVSEIINLYNSAVALSYKSSYNGIDAAKNVISEAKNYTNTQPLNNCEELMSNLDAIPKKIEASHVRYIESQVAKLSYYRNYDEYEEDDYENLATSVLSKIKDYKTNANTVYGYSSNIKSIEDKASSYYSNAKNYFEDRRGITINNPTCQSCPSNWKIMKIELSSKEIKTYVEYKGDPNKNYYVDNVYIEYDNKKYYLTEKKVNSTNTSGSSIYNFVLPIQPIANISSISSLDLIVHGAQFISVKINQ